MNLAFDSVELRDGRRGVLHGYVTRVYGEDSGRADQEGGVESSSRTKQSVKRAGIGATVGAIVGGIAGGGKGAAIGLIIGRARQQRVENRIRHRDARARHPLKRTQS